jgi:hypothetical protein
VHGGDANTHAAGSLPACTTHNASHAGISSWWGNPLRQRGSLPLQIDDTGRIVDFAEKPKGEALRAMEVDTTVLGLDAQR